MRFLIHNTPYACFAICILCGSSIVAFGSGEPFSRAGKSAPAANKAVPCPAGLHYYTPPKHRIVHTIQADVCVYGATSAGVIAAVQLRKAGLSVVLIEQGAHLGGMTSGGLSNTDIGNKAAIGGMARDFYRAIGKFYGEAEEWRFEPHVAEREFEELAAQNHIPVYYREFVHLVTQDHQRITSITMESGLTVVAKQYIDCGYEGDLMARSNVTYAIGREDNKAYNETLNGVQVRDLHQFSKRVDPFEVEGDASTGVVPGIDESPVPAPGTGDKRIQAYNFRMCVTRDPANKIPFPKPKGYNSKQYMLLERLLATGFTQVFDKFDDIKGDKFDKNNDGPVSTDYIGMNYAYPDGDYKKRERVFRQHVIYQMGLMWYLCNDSHVPPAIRQQMSGFGLCKDEFKDTDGWPHQLYIREARRMLSDYVMTEHNCRGAVTAQDSVGLAAYTMDSHNCRRFIENNSAMNEGDVEVGGMPPYPISYRAIVPRKTECTNLLVPVCLSATHIAYGSIRMEPVFMILGQSAALAAEIAIKHNCAVQDVSYAELRTQLEAAHQVLEWKAQR